MSEGLGLAESVGVRRAGRGRRGATAWLTVVPLLVVTVLIYNLLALFGSPDGVRAGMQAVAFTLPMTSGVEWTLTWGDLLVIVSLFLLFAELLKSTGSGSLEIYNHALSMMLFILCLIEFLLWAPCATSTFFIITLMALLDVLAGVIVTINSARRDVGVEG